MVPKHPRNILARGGADSRSSLFNKAEPYKEGRYEQASTTRQRRPDKKTVARGPAQRSGQEDGSEEAKINGLAVEGRRRPCCRMERIAKRLRLANQNRGTCAIGGR